MRKLTSIARAAILVIGLASSATNATSLYNYSGVITLCTGACAPFASLAVGSTVTGTIAIDTTPGGSFGDADINNFVFMLFNPVVPPEGPTGDPLTDNPIVLDSAAGVVASNGTAGTTDAADQIDSGQLLLELLLSPFVESETFIVFDLATGNGQMCIFYQVAGCIPNATESLKFEGQFSLVPLPAAMWLLLSAVGMLGWTRRKTG